VGEENDPEPDFVAEICQDFFESDGHQDIVEQVTDAGKEQEVPVEMEKELACLDVIDGADKEKKNYCR
jgi:hypothetical protein